VRDHPSWPDIRNRLGLVFAFEENFNDAVHEFQESLGINPNYKEALLNLGFSLFDVSRDSEALEVFNQVEVQSGFKNLGQAFLKWKRGEGEQSLQILKSSLGNQTRSFKTRKQSLTLILVTACMHFWMEQEKEASDLLSLIDGYKPFIPKTFERWINNFKRKSGTPSPDTETDSPPHSFFFLNPGLIQFYRSLADIYVSDGDFEGARNEVEKGLLVSGQLPEYLHDLGLLYTQQGAEERSIESFKKAIEFDPKFGKGHASLAIAYGNFGDTDLAIQEFKKAIEIHPRYPDLHYNLGLAYFDQGEYENAIEEFDKALFYNPRYLIARNSLAFCLFTTGKLKEALNQYLKVIEGGVTSADIYIHIGIIHKEQKNNDLALQYIEKACEIEPDYAEAHYHLGSIALGKGDIERTKKAFSKCLTLTQDPELIQKVEKALSGL
jgi:superkiller protein 3